MKHLSLDIRAPLGDFSLEIREDIPLSGVTALVGRSASGKSSLLRAIAGLDPCEGLIRFADDVWQDGKHQKVPAHRRRVGFVFQDIRLFEHLDVAGNIRFARRWQNGRGISDAALADIVAILDLGPLMHRQSARLSGGERQRVALARALAARPRIMLLDEPLSGLDPVQKQRLLPRIQRALHSAGCPAVFVSHDRDEVARFADRSLTIARGRVAARQAALPVYKALCKERGNQASFGDGVLRLGTTVNAGTRYFRLLEDQICLSEFDPGSSSAMLTVPVRVCEIPAGGLALEFSGAPDAALLPCPAALAALSIVTPGKTLWLTAASVALLQSPVEIKGPDPTPDPTPDPDPGPGG